MHITFLQSGGQAASRRPSPAAPGGRALIRPDSLYFSIAIAAGFLWLALSCF